MIVLDSSIQLNAKLDGAAGTPLPVYVAYADATPRTFQPDVATEALEDTNYVTICAAAPDADTRREVRLITVRNADAGARTVTFQLDGATGDPTPWVFDLAAGDLLVFDGGEWYVLDSDGQRKQTGGGGTPGGSDTHVQYNDAGAFGGEAGFAYDKTNNQLTVPGLTVAQDLVLGGILTPAQITADQDDYAPTDHATALVFRLSSDAANWEISGLAGGVAGRVVVLANVGSYNLLLMRESASSAAANRFTGPAGTDYLLFPGQAFWLVYDGTLSRWQIVTYHQISLANPFDVTGTLPVGNGGTGLAAVGNAYELLRTNAAGDALEFSSEYLRPVDVVTAETEVVSSVTETTVWSVTVPGNLLGTNGALRLRVYGDLLHNTGAGDNTFTIRIKYGGTTLVTYARAAATNAARRAVFMDIVLKADGATNAQKLFCRLPDVAAANSLWGSAAVGEGRATGTAAEDSTGDLTLAVTVQHSVNNANTSFLMKYAELLYEPAI